MSALTKIWLSVLLVALGAYGAWSAVKAYRQHARAENDRHTSRGDTVGLDTLPAPLASLEKFALLDRRADTFRFAELQGKVYVVNFFYTSCNYCRQITERISELYQDPELADVHFVSVTCDPHTDKSPTLDVYARGFNADPARWRFLTGGIREIKQLGVDVFGVATKLRTHSPRAIVVDAQGHRRGGFDVLDDVQFEKLRRHLIGLLHEQRQGDSPGESRAALSDDANQPAAS